MAREEPLRSRSAGPSPRPSSVCCSATSRSGCSASTTCSCPPTTTAPTDGDRVYYVGANVLALEKRYAFRPGDFRLWIALHEVTHRAQFTGVPWLRDYFVAQVHELVGGIEPDPGVLLAGVGRAAEAMRAGRHPIDERGIVGLFANDEQRATMDRVQALMSLLEGHGNAVMNHLGADLVAGQARMAHVLSARRNAGGITALLHRVMGLEMKMRQYEVGEAFVDAVTDLAGFRALDAAWAGPEQLPTLEELAAPAEWLARVARARRRLQQRWTGPSCSGASSGSKRP